MRGLQRRMPVLAGVFMVVLFASIGVPGLNGFVGEFLILAGTFLTHRWWAVAATVGVVLAAVYMLWAYQQAFHGKPTIERGAVHDLTWREGLVLAPLVILIVFLGIFPGPVLNRISPSVDRVVTHVEAVAHPHTSAPKASETAVRYSTKEHR
jgi:NADH-quinone oxidoreductase subunit M